MKVSIILPARNEEGLIGQTLKTVYDYIAKTGFSFEILIVVNGSADSTEQIVRNYSYTRRQIKIIKSKPGYGYALRAGLAAARGDYIVIYNVDFFDLKLIDLIKINLYGKDFIIGSKRAHWSQDFRPLNRKIISSLFNLYLKLIFKFEGSDTHGIKVMKNSVVRQVLPECKTYTGIFDTEFVLRSQKSNFKLADFPVIVKEVRTPRFPNRLLQTPSDVIKLTIALINE